MGKYVSILRNISGRAAPKYRGRREFETRKGEETHFLLLFPRTGCIPALKSMKKKHRGMLYTVLVKHRASNFRTKRP